MLKLENSIRGLSFSRVAFDLTIQGTKNPKECLVKELQEFEYVRSERWFMPIVGIALILLGVIFIYHCN